MEELKMNPRLAFLLNYQGKVIDQSPSAYMNWLAPVLEEASYGSLKCRYTVRKEMTNPMGLLHGGVTAGIIDDLIGATVFSMNLAAHYTTINNAIDYLAAAKLGDEIWAETRVVKQGRSIINLQCEVCLLPKNRLIARGYSNMLRLEV